jgi:hypothetical protein
MCSNRFASLLRAVCFAHCCSWGDNVVGQLGLEDTDPRGVAANTMGDALPVVDLGADKELKAVQVSSALD